MSADNWTICPNCAAEIEASRQQAILKAGELYGKVPAEEYIRAAQKAQEAPKQTETLREDWEIGSNGEEFYVSYSCSCSTCKKGFKFRHTEPLKLT